MRRLTLLLAVLLCVAAAGCGGAPSASPSTLTVLAAASLTDAFTEIGHAYERDHPGVRVRFSFAGSQDLAAQVRQGVPADVIATADQPTMDGLQRYVTDRRVFAHNALVIVVAHGNPKKVTGLADLARKDLTVVLAAPAVPVGRYSREVLARAGVHVQPKSQEQDVKAVVTRVSLGEADAGIVYATDVTAAGRSVTGVPIPPGQNLQATYPVAAITASRHLSAAKAFVSWLTSAQAQLILRKYGFRSP